MFRRAPVSCRPHAVSELLPPELAMVMLRLRKAGIILFEPNGYSLRYSRRFDPVSVLAQLWRPF